jgi:hypothetical protein
MVCFGPVEPRIALEMARDQGGRMLLGGGYAGTISHRISG